MITTILWDMDRTLLDFDAAERAAVQSLYIEFGLGECSEEALARYSAINRKYWEKMERGEITKQQVLVFEFRALSEEDIAEGLERALKSPKGLGNLNVELTEGALNQLVRLSGGDLRKAYNGLELAVLTTPRNADGKILDRKSTRLNSSHPK